MNAPTFRAEDHVFMARALQLAWRGANTTTPNPRVGCVLVADGVVIAEGFHARAGLPHAEALALSAAGERARGATAYVTLEPCNHHGRTPPCTEALIGAGVRRVVAAMQDPNPLVAGQGFARLAAAGVAVSCGLMEAEAREMNLGFVSRVGRGRPWLRVKIAASLDGKTALGNGQSQWITGGDARRDAHGWRARSCALMTGAGTLLQDDPSLTVREVPCERAPARVIVDGRLVTPVAARVFAGGGPVWIFHASTDKARMAALEARGAQLVYCPGGDGRVDVGQMLTRLGDLGMNEVLVEAGARLNGALLEGGWVDELLIYLAPTLLGGDAYGMFHTAPLHTLAERRDLVIIDTRAVGPDLRLIARLKPSSISG